MEYLKLVVQALGHIAWPIAIYLIASSFKSEISTLLKRVKKAKYKGVELDLESAIEEVKSKAENAGITMNYPLSMFPKETIDSLDSSPEWVFIRTWQEIENVLKNAYKVKVGNVGRIPITMKVISELQKNGVIDSEMASLINQMREVRNQIVHTASFDVTRGELLEWVGLSRSITDRLTQQLQKS